MLSRRHLRIKLMQSLYAFIQSGESDLTKGEKELMKSIDTIYDLYILLLDLFVELRFTEAKILAERKNKKLPTKEDLKPNNKFIENKVFLLLDSNEALKSARDERKLSWMDDTGLVRGILKTIKETETYKEYMSTGSGSFEDDKKFVLKIFKSCIGDNELLRDHFEEINIHWVDDIFFMCGSVVKTLKGIDEKSNSGMSLMPLYKDYEDDRQFVTTMFRQLNLNTKALDSTIEKKAKNWELDRIAAVDILLMKMAITELMEISSIPVKVTLNEYIELAKSYSTPKSKVFINGILDKLMLELKKDGDINKSGRGLNE